MICDRQDRARDPGEILLWRERIERMFIGQYLAGVTEVYDCNVEPAPVLDPSMPAYQYVVSAFTLRFKSREPRGV
jgi:hypothetical protein